MKLTSKPKDFSIRNVATGIMISVGLLLSAQASAESKCAGLDNSACTAAAASCTWVNGYERKDGKKVNAFCRVKAKKATPKTKQDK